MNYTTYNPNTGEIIGLYTIDDPNAVDINLSGKSFVEGKFNKNNYYIDNGCAIEIPTQPSIYHEFNYETKSWVENITLFTEHARLYRNSLLKDVDKINPVWYNSLTTEQQTEIAAYRQALLDVPQQSGWPTTIEWPTRPSWL